MATCDVVFESNATTLSLAASRRPTVRTTAHSYGDDQVVAKVPFDSVEYTDTERGG